MKRNLVLSAITLAGVLMFSSPASADHGRSSFGFGFGFGFGGGGVHLNYHRGHYRHHYRHGGHVHIHHRVPVYAQVWVPPVYNTVVVGYDHCGYPVYRQVLVCDGYYRQSISGYRCDGCGVTLY